MGALDRYLPLLSESGRRWIRFGLVLVALFCLWLLAARLSGVLTPIVASLAIAYILNPLVTHLERRGVARMRSTIWIYTIGFAILLSVLVLAATTGVAQTATLIANFDQYQQIVHDWIAHTFPNLLDRDRNERIARQWLSQYGQTVAAALAGYFAAAFGNVLWWGTAAVLIPIYTFVFLLNFNRLVSLVHDYLPTRSRPIVVRVATVTDSAMADFFRGRLMISAAVGVLTAVGWLLVGVPYSVPFGFAVGILNLVPVISIVVLPPAVFVTYLAAAADGGSWFWPVLLTIVVFFLVQSLDNFVLSPIITSHSSGLHPVTTVVALLVGAELGGVLGMLLSIPVTSALKQLAIEYVLPELRRIAGHSPAAVPPPAAEPSPAIVPVTPLPDVPPAPATGDVRA